MGHTWGPLISLAPLLVIAIPMAIAAYFLAPRVGANRGLWVLGSLIPLFNFFFMYYIAYKIAARVLDRLNVLHDRLVGPA